MKKLNLVYLKITFRIYHKKTNILNIKLFGKFFGLKFICHSIIFHKNIDVYFLPPLSTSFLPGASGSIIHDLAYLYFPKILQKDLWQLKNGQSFQIKKQTNIAVSKQQKDIIKNYGVDETKVSCSL